MFFEARHLHFDGVQDFISDPAVQEGMKKAFVRLANLEETNLEAVKLNWECAADALSTLAQRRLGLGWRRLGEKVTLCFEIDSEGEQESLKLCQVLSDVDPKGRWSVIKLDVGHFTQVSHPNSGIFLRDTVCHSHTT